MQLLGRQEMIIATILKWILMICIELGWFRIACDYKDISKSSKNFWK
jgi:hypothetical protein